MPRNKTIINCTNDECNHNDYKNSKCQLTTISINPEGKCENNTE